MQGRLGRAGGVVVLAVALAPGAVTAQAPHPTLRVGDALRLDVRLKLQADLDGSAEKGEANRGETFSLHRRRVGIQGRLFTRVRFEIERELQQHHAWRDVWVNVRAADALEIRAGRFKVPFGLEATTGITNLDFIHRTLGSSALAPGRSVGVMLHGERSVVTYEAGLFDDDVDRAAAAEPALVLPGESSGRTAPTLAARVTAAPFGRRFGSRPRVGLAVTVRTVPEGLNSLRGDMLTDGEFFEPVYVRGRRLRTGIQGEWNPGPFGVRGEYIRVAEARQGQGLGDIDLSDLIGRSWYVSATWMAAGSRKAGLELGTRVERLSFASAEREGPAFLNPRAEHIAPQGAALWTGGATWFVNRWLRVQGNLVRESYGSGDTRARSWRALLRTQVAL